MRQIIFVLFIVLFCSLVFGVTSNPTPFTIYQKDGSKIQVIRCGNEWNHWLETTDGYHIKHSSDGWWIYAGTSIGTNGKELKVGIDNPAGLSPKHFEFPGLEVPESARHPLGVPKANPFSSYRVLVLLVEFSDQSSLGSRTEDWAARVFQTPENSVADYYREISYGQFSITPAPESHESADDGVVGWLPLERPHPNTGDRTGVENQRLAKEAILAADPYVDFSIFDVNNDGWVSSAELGIIVVAAGYESSYSHHTPGVWAHQSSLESSVPAPTCDGVKIGAWEGTGNARTGGYIQVGEWLQSTPDDGHMAPIGIMAHELGHLAFDLPDRGNDETIDKRRDTTAGFVSPVLMGAGCWGEVTSGPGAGKNPAHMDPRSKAFCGFVNPDGATQPVKSGHDLNVPFSLTCWDDNDHTPTGHSHGYSLKCWSYAVIRSFKLKYPGKFSACDPENGTNITSISSGFFSSRSFSVSSAAYKDIVGTGDSGISHVAVIVSIYYPASLANIKVADANRFSHGNVITWDSLENMLDDRGESATKLYTPKDLTFPPSSPPTLQSPVSTSRFIGTSQNIHWSLGDFTYFTLLVDTNSSFSSPDQYGQSGTTKSLSCTRGYVYYWKVKGYNGCYYSSFSPAWHFSIASTAITGVSVGRHGPYTVGGDTVMKISITYEDAGLGDLSYIKVYKKFNYGSWQYVTTIQASQLPYTYNGPEITMVNGIPVKSGPLVYYEGRYYNSSGQYITGQISTCYYEPW